MNLSILTNGFLVYLQHNNAKLGNNRYQPSWLDSQANDFRKAMIYAEQRAPEVLNAVSGESLADFIKTIHQHCAPETYRIVINSVNGDAVQHERVGTFRTSESLAMKSVPLININHPQDKTFLSTGNMPRIIDGRLQLMGHNPQSMILKDKLAAIHGLPAWLEANSVVQISAYIHAHRGATPSYYFLCSYYREHFIKTTRSLTDRDRAFANFMENEINTLGKTLRLKFNKASTEFTSEEVEANTLVYTTYLSPEKISAEFANYAIALANDIRVLDINNPQKIAEFCFKNLQKYIRIHPFLDANYRTFGIFINAVLAHADYEYINFHDSVIKNALNVHFGENEPNKPAAIHVLNAALKRMTSSVQSTTTPIVSQIEPGKAIRTAAANGKADELNSLLRNYPDKINAIDQTPNKGWTALHWAISKEQVASVGLLLSSGAQYTIADKTPQKQTAIDLALSKNNDELIKLVAERILNQYVKSHPKSHEKALRNAANVGDLEAVKLLIRTGAVINAFGPETGQTALHRATQQKHALVVALLIESGADVGILDKSNKRAIDYAVGDEGLLTVFMENNVAKTCVH